MQNAMGRQVDQVIAQRFALFGGLARRRRRPGRCRPDDLRDWAEAGKDSTLVGPDLPRNRWLRSARVSSSVSRMTMLGASSVSAGAIWSSTASAAPMMTRCSASGRAAVQSSQSISTSIIRSQARLARRDPRRRRARPLHQGMARHVLGAEAGDGHVLTPSSMPTAWARPGVGRVEQVHLGSPVTAMRAPSPSPWGPSSSASARRSAPRRR